MRSPVVADAIADVAEGFCPLCRVALITHDDRAHAARVVGAPND
jgi:hypothetical protein